jgi:hypothetical protein
MGTEVVKNGADVFSKGNDNSDKWRNPNYPNLKYNTILPTPGVALDTTIQDESFLP